MKIYFRVTLAAPLLFLALTSLAEDCAPIFRNMNQNKLNCGYINNIEFSNMNARLVNRGPDMLSVYGTVRNNDGNEHTLVSACSSMAGSTVFHIYRQQGGTGNITMWPIDKITIPVGSYYTWEMGGPHIMMQRIVEKQMPIFGTQFQEGQTASITFVFSDGCAMTVNEIPIRDRIQE